MGGGKSRAICEEVFRLAMEFPGLPAAIARERHTSIIETTRKTFYDQVLPPELRVYCKEKASAGEDYCLLPNGSVIHFIGLEDPVKWFSSEMGLLAFDEGHEISEDTVVKLITRLRWPEAPRSSFVTVEAPDGVRGLVLVGFNPENPGHWLHNWFFIGGAETEHGFYKQALYPKDAIKPIGDSEFVFASAHDNVHLPAGYVEDTLGGLPKLLRQRYLEGKWVYTSGQSFFDEEALNEYGTRVLPARWSGHTAGIDAHMGKRLRVEGKTADLRGHGKIRVQPAKDGGPWSVWETPTRERFNEYGRKLPPCRYIVAVDVSSGEGADYSAIQVLCVETFSQVAEYQDKIDPDLLALEAYRIGRVYNDALIVPEVTGGYGFTIISELKRLGYGRIYMRRVRDRLGEVFTDKLGWDTSMATRMNMLDTLERVLRERELVLRGNRTLTELLTFVWDNAPKDGRVRRVSHPQARFGCHDDLVITLAMAVTVATQMPRQLRRVKEEKYEPAFVATGY